MRKRPEALETVRLILEILKRIPKGSKISARELHGQLLSAGLDRDLRTIQRQLQFLSENYDIECDSSSQPYGYRWKPESRGLAAPALTEQESLLLALAHEHLAYQLPASLLNSMGSLFSQAEKKLRTGERAGRERAWLGKVRVVSTSQPLLPPKIAPDVFEAVSQALYDDRWLEVDYVNAARKHRQAKVMPLGLAQQGPRLYLVCRFEGFENERSLALHRIRAARATTLPFDRPKEFNLKRYDDDGRFGFGEGERIRLSFSIARAAGVHLLETPLSKDQEVIDCGETLKVSATVVNSAQLRWWLRGFGKAVSDVAGVALEAAE